MRILRSQSVPSEWWLITLPNDRSGSDSTFRRLEGAVPGLASNGFPPLSITTFVKFHLRSTCFTYSPVQVGASSTQDWNPRYTHGIHMHLKYIILRHSTWQHLCCFSSHLGAVSQSLSDELGKHDAVIEVRAYGAFPEFSNMYLTKRACTITDGHPQDWAPVYGYGWSVGATSSDWELCVFFPLSRVLYLRFHVYDLASLNCITCLHSEPAEVCRKF